MTHWNRLTPLTPELANVIGKDPVLIFIETLGAIEACLRQSSDDPQDGVWVGCMHVEHWPFGMAAYWMPLPAQPHKSLSQDRPKDQETVLIWVKNHYGQFPAPAFGWLQARYHAKDRRWCVSNVSDAYWIQDLVVMDWVAYPEKPESIGDVTLSEILPADPLFIEAAEARGEDTFSYKDPNSGEFLMVSGSPESIRLLTEIMEDYELMCEVAEDIATELKRLHLGAE